MNADILIDRMEHVNLFGLLLLFSYNQNNEKS